ncbi:MAG: response regulator transcription factor [Rubrimonas sp.]|uniref:response regulator transcription factor n=1 Tax=Rubrimonas sp. TaxID=2036015 RepID=UPI002FDD3000
MTAPPRLLLVEDDTGIGRMLERGLAAEGYAVAWSRDLRSAVAAARDAVPDIVVLDRMLPDGDGVGLCRALRRFGVAAPVLMLTARDALEDKLEGFDAGADDYLAKPFEFDELLARLAALRRRGVAPAAELTLHEGSRSMIWGARRVRLTPREWKLMRLLRERAGEPTSRAALISEAWGAPGEVSENAVDVYIGYLRRKLAEVGAPARIETVRGVGFMLAP